MKNEHDVEKAGRKLIRFWVPDYVYSKVEGVVGEGNINSACKLFVSQVSQGKAKLQFSMENPKGK